MRLLFVVLSVLASWSVAAETIQFFFPEGSEGVDPVATIQQVKPSTTEFSIACPTNVDSNDCGWGPGMNYTILSRTHYQAEMSYDSFSMSFACDHNTQASEMTCTVAMTGGNFDTTEPETAVLKGSEIAFNSATIVQGASLLSGTPASAAPKSTPTASGGLMTDASPSSTGTGVRGSSSGLRSATGSAAPAEHTAAATRSGIQGSALLTVLVVVTLFSL